MLGLYFRLGFIVQKGVVYLGGFGLVHVGCIQFCIRKHCSYDRENITLRSLEVVVVLGDTRREHDRHACRESCSEHSKRMSLNTNP